MDINTLLAWSLMNKAQVGGVIADHIRAQAADQPGAAAAMRKPWAGFEMFLQYQPNDNSKSSRVEPLGPVGSIIVSSRLEVLCWSDEWSWKTTAQLWAACSARLRIAAVVGTVERRCALPWPDTPPINAAGKGPWTKSTSRLIDSYKKLHAKPAQGAPAKRPGLSNTPLVSLQMPLA